MHSVLQVKVMKKEKYEYNFCVTAKVLLVINN